MPRRVTISYMINEFIIIIIIIIIITIIIITIIIIIIIIIIIFTSYVASFYPSPSVRSVFAYPLYFCSCISMFLSQFLNPILQSDTEPAKSKFFLFPWVSVQSHLSVNDKGDNDMIPGAMHRCLGIYLTGEEYPGKSRLGDHLSDLSSSQMGSLPLNEAGRITQRVRKEEGRKERKDPLSSLIPSRDVLSIPQL